MIYFFKIKRWKSLKDHKYLKYSKYVLGEIFIVIIGILVAIQINNWNEQKKKDLKKQVYLERLIHDLGRDTLNLNMYYSYCDFGLRVWRKIEKQIQKPNTTIDSIIKIFKYDVVNFSPEIKHLNKATYNSLLSTGDIELFQEDHLVMLMDFYALRENSTSAIIRYQEFVGSSSMEEFSFLRMKDETSIFYTKQREKLDEAKFLRTFYDLVKVNSNTMHTKRELAHYGLVRTREVLKILNNPSENSYSDISHIFK